VASRRQKATPKAAPEPAAQAPTQEPVPAGVPEPSVGPLIGANGAPITRRRKIRVITNPPEETRPQTTMGRAVRPFAKPAQSGTFAPFAVAQARRGH
jgi:hypothetical protein